MANLGVSNITSNSITCYIYNLDTTYSENDRYIYWYAGNSYKGTSYLSAYISSGGTFTISGLASSTYYSLHARVYYKKGTEYVDLYGSATTSQKRPNYYYWTYAKQSGQAFNLTASEWNGLTANINAVRNYRGYSSYSFTYVYIGNPFYAYMYNQAVNAIQGISGYGSYIYTVSSGSIVYASQLNQLISELNAIP